MSLSFILDDIADQGGPLNHSGPSDQVNVSSLEHLKGLPVLVERVNKVNESLTAQRLVKEVLSQSTVSKATAMEVFTMLPVMSEQSALLTTAPTVHNHRLVAKASTSLFSNPKEAEGVFNEVLDLVNKTLEVSSALIQACKQYQDELSSHVTRLTNNPPMVIVDRTAINLMTADIWSMYKFDTYSLGYTPYEGVLDLKFKAIEYNPAFIGLVKDCPDLITADGNPTLSSVTAYLMEKAKDLVEYEKVLVEAKPILENAHGISPPSSLATCVFDALKGTKKHEELFTGKDCLAAVVVSCLSFLV